MRFIDDARTDRFRTWFPDARLPQGNRWAGRFPRYAQTTHTILCEPIINDAAISRRLEGCRAFTRIVIKRRYLHVLAGAPPAGSELRGYFTMIRESIYGGLTNIWDSISWPGSRSI